MHSIFDAVVAEEAYAAPIVISDGFKCKQKLFCVEPSANKRIGISLSGSALLLEIYTEHNSPDQ